MAPAPTTELSSPRSAQRLDGAEPSVNRETADASPSPFSDWFSHSPMLDTHQKSSGELLVSLPSCSHALSASVPENPSAEVCLSSAALATKDVVSGWDCMLGKLRSASEEGAADEVSWRKAGLWTGPSHSRLDWESTVLSAATCLSCVASLRLGSDVGTASSSANSW